MLAENASSGSVVSVRDNIIALLITHQASEVSPHLSARPLFGLDLVPEEALTNMMSDAGRDSFPMKSVSAS